MANEANFRFSLRHGTSTPLVNDNNIYELFIIGPDANYDYFLGVKVPDPNNTKPFVYRFLKLYSKSSFPTSVSLPDDPSDN